MFSFDTCISSRWEWLHQYLSGNAFLVCTAVIISPLSQIIRSYTRFPGKVYSFSAKLVETAQTNPSVSNSPHNPCPDANLAFTSTLKIYMPLLNKILRQALNSTQLQHIQHIFTLNILWIWHAAQVAMHVLNCVNQTLKYYALTRSATRRRSTRRSSHTSPTMNGQG